MRVADLAKQLNVSNKEIISFLTENGYVYKSHMQTLDDEAYDFAIQNYKNQQDIVVNKEISNDEIIGKVDNAQNNTVIEELRKYNPDDLIPCKSVVPYKLNALSVDKNKVYHWEYFGDVDYLTYRDLSALRRSNYVTKPLILIEDADLCYQWRRELGDTYKYFLGVEYPEELFDMEDAEFEVMLKKAPQSLKDVVKITTMVMIRANNYPSVQKVRLIDDILGTCMMDFLS